MMQAHQPGQGDVMNRCVQPSHGCCLKSALSLVMAAVIPGQRNFTRTVTRVVSFQLKAAASLAENAAGKYSLCCW